MRGDSLEELNLVEEILEMSQTLRKISEKKLIKEVETNFKLVGILLAELFFLTEDTSPGDSSTRSSSANLSF